MVTRWRTHRLLRLSRDRNWEIYVIDARWEVINKDSPEISIVILNLRGLVLLLQLLPLVSISQYGVGSNRSDDSCHYQESGVC